MKHDYHKELQIPVSGTELAGELIIPKDADTIVIFSHGSGSSRKSVRNQKVAQRLNKHHFGTLLFDLLTEEEDKEYSNRFNINLLTARLVEVTKWLIALKEFSGYKLGYFGASTGAASALKAAALVPQVSAIVSRGGRPDLAMDILHKITAPVLLIVGSLDYDVLELNEKAYMQLKGIKKLTVINGATHLFEEPGTMDQVAEAAILWFQKYLTSVKTNIQSYV